MAFLSDRISLKIYLYIGNQYDELFIKDFVDNTKLNFYPDQFVEMYNKDQLGGLIRNVDFWVKDVFQDLLENK